MSRLVFPILEVDDNRLLAVSGNVGRFYSLTPPDLEQMSELEIERFYTGISSSLDNLDEQHYFKFYSWQGESYLETNSDEVPNLSGVSITNQAGALEKFFHHSELISDIALYDDYLSFNGNYWRVLSVSDFGETQIDHTTMPIDVDYVLTIKKQSTLDGVKRLERVRSSHMSSLFKGKRDLNSEGAYSQAEELLEDLTHAREQLFSIELFFVVKADCLGNLNLQTKELHSYLAAQGISASSEGQSLRHLKSGLGELFNELIPGVRPKLGLRGLTDKTSHLRYLLPLKRSHLMDQGLVFHDRNAKELYFDPFSKDVPNRNMLVTGATGSGKSVFVNKLVHPLIENHPTVILDMGGSFKRLTLYHGGTQLSRGINPMQFRDAEFLREIILTQVEHSRFDKLECGRLLKSIKTILADDSVSSFDILLQRLESDFNGISLYFEESLSAFSDELVPDTNLLYVDIEDYPKSMIAPIILFVFEYFRRIEVSQKILVLDECWEFLKGHAKYIEKCFRTIRKKGGLPIALSQGLEDFSKLDDEICSAITNSSYFKVLFPQELVANQIVNDFDIERIDTLRFEKGVMSECYLLSKDHKYRKIIANYLTPLELELFHTENGEDAPLINFLNDNRAYFGSNKEAIEAFVRFRYGEDHYSHFPWLNAQSECQYSISS